MGKQKFQIGDRVIFSDTARKSNRPTTAGSIVRVECRSDGAHYLCSFPDWQSKWTHIDKEYFRAHELDPEFDPKTHMKFATLKLKVEKDLAL